jgi:ADP-heptose:LPS heptosyltransferase/glycosyltransferase involved in cell wall biosynthesis
MSKSIGIEGRVPERKRILLVGEHPHSWTGNGHFMAEVLKNIDPRKYDACVIATTGGVKQDVFQKGNLNIVEAGMDPMDRGGTRTLLAALERTDFDLALFVGLDIWAYIDIHKDIALLRDRNRFLWAWWFPMDAWKLRDEWVELIEAVDIPIVYSQYGYDMIKPKVDRIQYLRPPIPFEREKFINLPSKDKKFVREKIFHSIPKDSVIFGFVGANQVRKDPQRLMKAFFEAKKKIPNAVLYMHTEPMGYYNLKQYAKDCGAESKDLFFKVSGIPYTTEALVELINCFDCYVMPSMQEGLSVTILEAWACGVPVIATDTTSQSELLTKGAIPVPVTDLSYIPIPSEEGSSWHEAKSVNIPALVDAMVLMGQSPELRAQLAAEGLERYKEWVDGIPSLDKFFDVIFEEKRKRDALANTKLERVLFAQHSSAGDVLMTTCCFKGLKERYGNLPLDYMTSPQYMDILKGNPHIDLIIPWDEKILQKYRYVVNPHGERILPGHWGRNSNSLLADFYWKILKVEPTDAFIQMVCPENMTQELINKLSEELFVAVHTTGGDPEFRTYKYMADVCAGVRERGYPTVQLGGKEDYPAGADIDLRGKLSFRETAWVMDEAVCAITVDSFISHLAGFFSIPQICLFGSGNHNVVRPVGEVICMVPDYVNCCKGLGPCSASVKDCPVKCTGIHSPEDILKEFDNLTHGWRNG